MTTTAQLHRNLEEKQAEITGIARQIEHRLDAYRDWPQLVRKHPLESVGLAVGAGLVLSNSTG
ncbi:hypothetical protein, partial [Salmonella enterica]|uniref:hypothetical protein n=1 Tax=Salmonella enterica TaxID=28901 RepID=UPI003D2C86A6